MRNKDGFTGKLFIPGVIKLQNLGATPAYNVEYKLVSKDFYCTQVSKFALAPHQVKPLPTSCHSRINLSANGYSIFNLQGTVTYTDGFGQTMNEPVLVALRVGGPLDHPFFEPKTGSWLDLIKAASSPQRTFQALVREGRRGSLRAE
ncbi:MAG TPA: hypothetical protein VEX68_17975 [Bryobacteraceae bacterium]|nr:hypothetical protein [Bryobacteraceae bacterium]